MATLPRQELDELVTKYELHPDLIDIYVEGAFDRDFVNQFLDAVGIRASVSVYSIEGVNVPVELVARLGLTGGSNKHRLVALAAALTEELSRPVPGVCCVVDADLDRACEAVRSYPQMRYTDYTCMEMYSLNKQTITRFITFACNLSEKHANEFMQVAAAILPVQFATRVAVSMLGLGVGVPGVAAGFKVKKDFSSFDADQYFERFVQAGRLVGRREEIRLLLDDVRSRLGADLRHKTHGHDFVALLFAFSWECGGVKLHNKDDDVVRFGGRLIASGLDFASLREEQLFASILEVSVQVSA